MLLEPALRAALTGRHPLTPLLDRLYRAQERLLRIQLHQARLRRGQGAVDLPLPHAVKPPPTS